MKRVAVEESAASLPALEPGLSSDECEEHFVNIARALLCNRALEAGPHTFRFLEVEVYCKSKGHDDVFTHGDDVQRTANSFYFHKTGKSYRGGTYKGMDITFGNVTEPAGMLIRSLQDEASGEVICGPSLVVDKLLKVLECDSIATLVAKHGIEGKSEQFHLVIREQQAEALPIYRSPRVGLSLKTHSYSQSVAVLWSAPLRFVVHPRLLTKHKHLLALSLMREGKTNADIATVTNSRVDVVGTWANDFEKGKREDIRKYFGAKSDSVSQYCHCYGAATVVAAAHTLLKGVETNKE